MQLRAGGQKLKDNRKYRRVHSRLRCWCEGKNVTFYARVGNLSEGGLFLKTSTPLTTGSEATLRFEGAGGPPVQARATVMWARGEGDEGSPGMGLRFEQVDSGQLERLREIILGEQKTDKSNE